MQHTAPSIDPQEVEKFTRMAEEWWDEGGKFRPLHRINPVRIQYIRDKAVAHFGRQVQDFPPLAGLSLLDVGCGGGLLSEPMARLGASVTGIDASEKNIGIATAHMADKELPLTYRATSVEQIVAEGQRFDMVLAMEVVEHVADVPGFIHACCAAVKPGGVLFMATLSRTLKSYAMAIIGAEYIMRWLPKGTHDWKKFLSPAEVAAHLRREEMQLAEVQGLSYRVFSDEWYLSQDTDVNYMLVAVKKERR